MGRQVRLLGAGVLICSLQCACSVGPSVMVPIGYNADIEYPDTFQVIPSETGPQDVQSHIAQALTRVLHDKGLLRNETPGVIFTLRWSSQEALCDTEDPAPGCVPRTSQDQLLIRAHLLLEARETDLGARIWQAEFSGLREPPVDSPTLAEIEAIFVPAFAQALADYPQMR